MTPLDVTTSSGLAQLSAALQPGTYVNVFALPKSSGMVQAYTIVYYTGINPRQVAPSSGNSCNGTFTGLFAGTLTVTDGQDCVFSSGATIEGNVHVNGGTLEISGATVKGQVQVRGGGTLSILQSTLIKGNLQIQDLPAGSAQIRICGATIDGNLQYQNNAAAVTIGGAPACADNTIRGNLQVNGNSAPTVIFGNMVTGNVQDQNNSAATEVSGNTIGGNLQVQNNTGASTQVSGNVVSKNLQCENNASISGGGNSAQKKQDQCASL
jgi:cytoskeletal protein CcmA (bactofilin family)